MLLVSILELVPRLLTHVGHYRIIVEIRVAQPRLCISLVVLAALVVVFVWFGLSVVRDVRNDSRLRRLYEEAEKPEDA
jgi:hypothetical protein